MAAEVGAGRYTAEALNEFARDLRRDGIVVIRSLIDPDKVAAWAAAFDQGQRI